MCKLNHSCNPNCEVTFEAATGAGVVLKALRPIKPEEELTISYVNAEAAEPQRAAALRNYLFRCECDKCSADRTQPQPATAQGYGPLPPLEAPRPMDLTAKDLTVALEEGPGGRLSSETTERAAALLATAGVVALSPHAAVTVVRTGLLEDCRVAALAACDRLETVLRGQRASGAGLQDGEAPFRYHEICWRGEGRYDVKCDLATAPWSDPSLKELPALAPLLERVLGRDYKLLFAGCVVARPGAGTQGLHADGGHLFRDNGDGSGEEEPDGQGRSPGGEAGRYTSLLPPHCVNVFLPLVDLTEELGPTEFYPGSVALGTVRLTSTFPLAPHSPIQI
eukprot:COSAG03_NODE_1383_length_4194_cov_21.321123_1_plen_337_part_00